MIRTVWGDRLPQEVPTYPAVDLSQRLPWQEIDAVLISVDLLYQAQEDARLKEQLQGIYRQNILLVYRATGPEVVQILELEAATIRDTSDPVILVSVQMKGSLPMTGVLMVPAALVADFDLPKGIESYVRNLQDQGD